MVSLIGFHWRWLLSVVDCQLLFACSLCVVFGLLELCIDVLVFLVVCSLFVGC